MPESAEIVVEIERLASTLHSEHKQAPAESFSPIFIKHPQYIKGT